MDDSGTAISDGTGAKDDDGTVRLLAVPTWSRTRTTVYPRDDGDNDLLVPGHEICLEKRVMHFRRHFRALFGYVTSGHDDKRGNKLHIMASGPLAQLGGG